MTPKSHPTRVTPDSYLNLLKNKVLTCFESHAIIQGGGFCRIPPPHIARTQSCVGYQVNFRTVSSVAKHISVGALSTSGLESIWISSVGVFGSWSVWKTSAKHFRHQRSCPLFWEFHWDEDSGRSCWKLSKRIDIMLRWLFNIFSKTFGKSKVSSFISLKNAVESLSSEFLPAGEDLGSVFRVYFCVGKSHAILCREMARNQIL